MPQVECIGEIHYCPARDNSLSMVGSSSQEGRVVLSDTDPAYVVSVPLPPGVDTMQTLRIEVFGLESDTNTGSAESKGPVFRDLSGASAVGVVVQASSGIVTSPMLSAVPGGVEFPLAPANPGNTREYAFRWTLSPVYKVPFNFSFGP